MALQKKKSVLRNAAKPHNPFFFSPVSVVTEFESGLIARVGSTRQRSSRGNELKKRNVRGKLADLDDGGQDPFEWHSHDTVPTVCGPFGVAQLRFAGADQ